MANSYLGRRTGEEREEGKSQGVRQRAAGEEGQTGGDI